MLIETVGCGARVVYGYCGTHTRKLFAVEESMGGQRKIKQEQVLLLQAAAAVLLLAVLFVQWQAAPDMEALSEQPIWVTQNAVAEQPPQARAVLAELENRIGQNRLGYQMATVGEAPLVFAAEGADAAITTDDGLETLGGEAGGVGVTDGADTETVSYSGLYPNLYTTPLKLEQSEQETQEEPRKTVYLTFDDGPSRNTCEVLEALADAEVTATFFIVGESISETGLECLREIAEQGHMIGLHCYHHDYGTLYRSVEAFLEDYNQLFELIYQETGIKPNIYRFPGGSRNSTASKAIMQEIAAEMSRRGFTYYDWNVTAEDSVGKPTAYSIKKNLFPTAFSVDAPVVLLHDSPINSLTASLVPDIIEAFLQEGYRFDTLDAREPCQFHWQ